MTMLLIFDSYWQVLIMFSLTIFAEGAALHSFVNCVYINVFMFYVYYVHFNLILLHDFSYTLIG